MPELNMQSAQSKSKSKLVICGLASMLCACAATPQAPEASKSGLTCSLPSNCVSSIGNGGMQTLRFVGNPAQAMAALQATLKSFPEASVVRTDTLSLEVIFTTALGFKDQVDFQIDAQAQQVDFRSRSLLGLYDFGKNRARMQEFTACFAKQVPR
jgi:uncharacterized protein (DUF1499 family)